MVVSLEANTLHPCEREAQPHPRIQAELVMSAPTSARQKSEGWGCQGHTAKENIQT